MDTYFAPAERENKDVIFNEIEIIQRNPVVSGLLHSISGLLAVLNDKRQIIALNDSFLQMLNIDNPRETLGLRPGEAVNCIHSDEEPGGCGTSKYCSTCGAAIAIVASLKEGQPVERVCALCVDSGEKTDDIALLVKSHPIQISGSTFILLFLQDITLQQQRAALERTFFHDVNNMLCGLIGASEVLTLTDCATDITDSIRQTSLRLKKEVEIQGCLMSSEVSAYNVVRHKVTVEHIFDELQSFYLKHPMIEGKEIVYIPSLSTQVLNTDVSLVLRILCNMVTNALEACDVNEKIKIWAEHENGEISFYVWNRKAIPKDISLRVFQRNFTTKSGAGRGIGTYSMKLFGEQILGGTVGFTSSKEAGTEFRFSLAV